MKGKRVLGNKSSNGLGCLSPIAHPTSWHDIVYIISATRSNGYDMVFSRLCQFASTISTSVFVLCQSILPLIIRVLWSDISSLGLNVQIKQVKANVYSQIDCVWVILKKFVKSLMLSILSDIRHHCFGICLCNVFAYSVIGNGQIIFVNPFHMYIISYRDEICNPLKSVTSVTK